jgi:uncharacterized protein DUF1441
MASTTSQDDCAGVARIDEGLLSISCIARESGRDRRTISRMIDDAGIQPASSRNSHPVYRLRDVLAILTDSDGQQRPQDILALARARESETDNQLKQDKLLLSRGLLCDREEVRREMAELVMPLVGMLQTLPEILERDCGLSPSAVVRAHEVIERERTKLAETLEK